MNIVHNRKILIMITNNDSSFVLSGRLKANDIQPVHKHVTSLTVKNCPFSPWSNVAQSIASLEELHTLTVQQCKDADHLCLQLRNSKSLRRLSISPGLPYAEQSGVTQKGVKRMAEIAYLEELELDEKEAMTIQAFKCVSKLKKLLRLEMRQPDIKEIDFSSFGLNDVELIANNLPGLVILHICNNPIEDKDADIIGKHLPRLNELNIAKTNITSKGLLSICRNLRLTKLTITENCYEDGAVVLARQLPRLRTLQAAKCQFGWQEAALLSNNLTHLECLYFAGNIGLFHGCSGLGKLPRLKILYAEQTGLTDQMTFALATQLRKLQQLNICENDISEECEARIRQAVPRRTMIHNYRGQ